MLLNFMNKDFSSVNNNVGGVRMNNKDPKKVPTDKKRVFYIALLSCVGALLVIAAVASFVSLAQMNKDEPQVAVNPPASLGETVQTGTNESYGYLAPDDRTADSGSVAGDSATSGTLAASSGNKTVATPAPVSPTAAPSASKPLPTVAPSKAGTTGTPAPQAAAPGDSPDTGNAAADASAGTDYAQAPSPITQQATGPFLDSFSAPPSLADNSVTVAAAQTDEPFTPFADGGQMSWPVVGATVMPFSGDQLVYDSTLDQYRTNNDICIAADVGTQVRATAAGVVVDVTNNRQNGNEVVIDNGNGWRTTYSQLQDGVLVQAGDIVTEGQIIGGVGSPSIFSMLLGSHLEFKVEKDNVAIDPTSVLAALQ